MSGARILVIDNYDSFTFNLVQYLAELGARPTVVLNDEVDVARIERMRFDGLLISPGPGRPEDAGVSMDAIRALDGRKPILGVCLGHQSIAQVYGGKVVRAANILHGKTSDVLHAANGLFEGIPNPFVATRYHSLIVPREGLPESLQVVAWTQDDEIMALRRRDTPTFGVQFHPESILTDAGHELLRNFLRVCDA